MRRLESPIQSPRPLVDAINTLAYIPESRCLGIRLYLFGNFPRVSVKVETVPTKWMPVPFLISITVGA